MKLAEYMLANPPKNKSARVIKHKQQILFLKGEGYSFGEICKILGEVHGISIDEKYLALICTGAAFKKAERKSKKNLANIDSCKKIDEHRQKIYALVMTEAAGV